MALTQTDLDNLDSAIAMGELRVEFNGRMVIYRHVDELIRARAHVAQLLSAAGLSGNGPKRTSSYRYNFTTSRGD